MEQELENAGKCLIEVLESYLEFVDMVRFNCEISSLPEQFSRQMNTLCTRRKNSWQPILDKLKKDFKEEKCQI